MAEYSALILAGGKGSRLHYCDKALLKYNEKMNFLEKILFELEEMDEIIVSRNKPLDKIYSNVKVVKDEYIDIGPIAGIYSGLLNCKNEYLFIITCDTPNINKKFIKKILEAVDTEYDAILVKDNSGHLNSLCGVYKKSLLPLFKEAIEKERYKVLGIRDKIKIKILEFKEEEFNIDFVLKNVNTEEDLKNLHM